MQARTGDHVIIDGHQVGTTPRRGEVLEVSGSTLTVAWDDGHESIFVPGPDCRIVPREGAAAAPERLGASIDLRMLEDDDHCEAIATLMTRRGTFEGRGTAHRHPRDRNVPVIGEELAVGRALRALSDQLLDDGLTADAEGRQPAGRLLG